jgi:hypothetical protein
MKDDLIREEAGKKKEDTEEIEAEIARLARENEKLQALVQSRKRDEGTLKTMDDDMKEHIPMAQIKSLMAVSSQLKSFLKEAKLPGSSPSGK